MKKSIKNIIIGIFLFILGIIYYYFRPFNSYLDNLITLIFIIVGTILIINSLLFSFDIMKNPFHHFKYNSIILFGLGTSMCASGIVTLVTISDKEIISTLIIIIGFLFILAGTKSDYLLTKNFFKFKK